VLRLRGHSSSYVARVGYPPDHGVHSGSQTGHEHRRLRGSAPITNLRGDVATVGLRPCGFTAVGDRRRRSSLKVLMVDIQGLHVRRAPVVSAGDVDVDGLVCHRGDKVVLGSRHTGVGARERLARANRVERALVQRGAVDAAHDDLEALRLLFGSECQAPSYRNGRTTHLCASSMTHPPRNTHKALPRNGIHRPPAPPRRRAVEARQDLNNLSASSVRTGLSE
jgi:hypothetical protein